jgi:hypothetical protein
MINVQLVNQMPNIQAHHGRGLAYTRCLNGIGHYITEITVPSIRT